MNLEALKEKIQKMNNPQVGSLGEFIVAEYGKNVLQQEVIGVHRDGVDLIFNGYRVDVGARRQLDKDYYGGKIPNKDIFVFFTKDCCVIKYPSRFEAMLTWEDVGHLFEEWQRNHSLKIASAPDLIFKAELNELKGGIFSFFSDNGYKSRIIYRSVSRQFGLSESPDNLLPKVIQEKVVSVYIDLNIREAKPENIRFIIAFPDIFESEIPKQQKVVLKSGKKNVVKVDLKAIIEKGERCYFENLNQLFDEFFHRYPTMR